MWHKKLALTLAVFTLMLTGCANWHPDSWFSRSHYDYSHAHDKNYYGNYYGANFYSNTNLAVAVKKQIMANNKLAKQRIYVSSNKGNILLTGMVRNDRQRMRAVDIARHVPGVTSVTDALHVRFY